MNAPRPIVARHADTAAREARLRAVNERYAEENAARAAAAQAAAAQATRTLVIQYTEQPPATAPEPQTAPPRHDSGAPMPRRYAIKQKAWEGRLRGKNPPLPSHRDQSASTTF